MNPHAPLVTDRERLEATIRTLVNTALTLLNLPRPFYGDLTIRVHADTYTLLDYHGTHKPEPPDHREPAHTGGPRDGHPTQRRQ
jgi:hypothetical protein